MGVVVEHPRSDGPAYYRQTTWVNPKTRTAHDAIVYDFTQAPLGIAPRAEGVIGMCARCNERGEVSRRGEYMHAVHHATAWNEGDVRRPSWKFKVDRACKWDAPPIPAAHRGLFGGEGDEGLFDNNASLFPTAGQKK